MKKIFILILLIPLLTYGQNRYDDFIYPPKKNLFLRLNVGMVAIEGHGIVESIFPRASLITGGTFIKNRTVYEIKGGLAARPTSLTGRIGVGHGNLDRNILFTIRPWPLFFGTQSRINRFNFSFEVGLIDLINYNINSIIRASYRLRL